jgi:hypothetical protein
MPDEVSYPDARERHVTVARVALHRAADLLEAARTQRESLEVDEALELVFLALEELEAR